MTKLNLTADEVLTTTRSVRKRLDYDRPVSRAVVEECLDIALQAPSGGNLNIWHWLLVDDRATIKGLAEIYVRSMTEFTATGTYPKSDLPRTENLFDSARYLMETLDRAPIMVVPMIQGRLEGANVAAQATQWGSILPSAWSLMLALRERGLGSAWTTVHLVHEREAAQLLGIPYDQWTQAGLFPIAHTIGTDFKKAVRKPVSEVASWNRYKA